MGINLLITYIVFIFCMFQNTNETSIVIKRSEKIIYPCVYDYQAYVISLGKNVKDINNAFCLYTELGDEFRDFVLSGLNRFLETYNSSFSYFYLQHSILSLLDKQKVINMLENIPSIVEIYKDNVLIKKTLKNEEIISRLSVICSIFSIINNIECKSFCITFNGNLKIYVFRNLIFGNTITKKHVKDFLNSSNPAIMFCTNELWYKIFFKEGFNRNIRCKLQTGSIDEDDFDIIEK